MKTLNVTSNGHKEQSENTCYVVVRQAWSGLIRDACSYCDVTVPEDAICCPACGSRILGR